MAVRWARRSGASSAAAGSNGLMETNAVSGGLARQVGETHPAVLAQQRQDFPIDLFHAVTVVPRPGRWHQRAAGRPGLPSHQPRPRALAITRRWIWLVPSTIWSTFASRR